MDLDFVIVIVTSCITEQKVTIVQKNICIDIAKNAIVGRGGGQITTFTTFFDPESFIIFLILNISPCKSKAYLHVLLNIKETVFAQQRFS